MSQLVASNTKEITVYEAVHHGESVLKAYDKKDARIDARLLMRHLLAWDEAKLILNQTMILSEHIKESYLYLIAKRAQGIPLQYITKNQEFMGLEFFVDERVLIPRQDTETLVEHLLELAKSESIKKVIEIGVGSGCISISLAHYRRDMKITAIDISEDALDVAKKNGNLHGVNAQIEYVKSDGFINYKGEEESIDLVVSNPPYISQEECMTLMAEVKCCEPLIALTDRGDGLSFYRILSKDAKKFLKPGGIIAYEIGYNQGEAVRHILTQEEYSHIEVIKDLTGKDRVVIARKPL
ncbi:protein-(glutamine-N5) methyltransferase, release factor-specific [Sporanaerobium hydrogeniformans]|uniref:Protein-(Glutamine-N5) methyltransferase, release factor-specific n=1 Tax=Sporanaerobium hydrogeniformans TaxID=3072179 RepID=A0AC61DJ36_9FIRM|nr:peptide chain release factor N(5)-glutamine methyltransferase [Sporanaerobium hydrogeniformans]PHV72032.1 protein-(glutamine-N5) methyltransferase, release factor-specific [Sporanaerobium hydrogeniformans]